MLKMFVDEKLTYRADEIRGVILAMVTFVVLVTSPWVIIRFSIIPAGILLCLVLFYYGLLYRRLFKYFSRTKASIHSFKHLQSVFNLLIISALVHYTGGVESYYTSLYVFEIIVSGFLLSARECLWEASLAWMLYSLILWLEMNKSLPHVSIWPGMEGQYAFLSVVLISIVRMLFICYASALAGACFSRIFKQKSQEIEHLVSKISLLTLKIADLTINDSVSGFFNQKHFRLRLLEQVLHSHRYKRLLSLTFIRINCFKDFVKTGGKGNAGKAIATLSSLMRQSFREVEIFSRYDEDTFAIIMPETNGQGTIAAVERFFEKAKDCDFGPGGSAEPTRLSMNAGIASYPDDSNNPDGLTERALYALFEAGKMGENKICLYEKISRRHW